MSEQTLSQNPILLFDGVCSVCNGFIAFIIRQDPGARFRFASLQSEAGQKLLKFSGLQVNQDTLNTVVLIHQGKSYVKSEAALRVLRLLKAPWSFAGLALTVFPRPLRDRLYDLVARNRYRWFGRKETCIAPALELRQRFLSHPGS